MELIDALLDAGADIEHASSSIDGGSPLSFAVGYGQRAAARRLAKRGAKSLFWHEVALGFMSAITKRVETDPRPQPEDLSRPFWNACHGGQLAAAQYLLVHGRRSQLARSLVGQTPLDIAEQAGWSDVVAWLIGQAASLGKRGA